MKYGGQVIKELGKHGLRGYYFSYKQYMALAKIDNIDEVKDKIIEWGYRDVKNASNASEIVTILKKSNSMTESEKGCLAALGLEGFFWLILLIFSGC